MSSTFLILINPNTEIQAAHAQGMLQAALAFFGLFPF